MPTAAEKVKQIATGTPGDSDTTPISTTPLCGPSITSILGHDTAMVRPNRCPVPGLVILEDGTISPAGYFDGLDPTQARQSMKLLEAEYKKYLANCGGNMILSTAPSQELIQQTTATGKGQQRVGSGGGGGGEQGQAIRSRK